MRVRFIVYSFDGSLRVVERQVLETEHKFDVCRFFNDCPYSDIDGVICIEENDTIRESVCPEFKKNQRVSGSIF